MLFMGSIATLQGVSAPATTASPSPSASPSGVAPSASATPAASASPSSTPKPVGSKPIVPAGDATAAPTAKAAPPPTIFISDTENHRIVQIDDMSGKGMKAIGSAGHGLGRLLNPAQVWVDYKQRIYIADKGNHRIIRVDDITGKGWSEMEGFDSPEGVAVRGNEVIISDSATNKVMVYTDFGGNLTKTYTDSRLQHPGHLWLDEKNILYVSCGTDTGGRVVKMTVPEDSTKWTVFEGQGLTGTGFSPSQIITEKKYVWLTDSSSSRLVRCEDLQGRAPHVLGGIGNKMGRFQNPQGLAVDKKGNLYVADTGNDRIIFVPNGDVANWTDFDGKGNSISLRAPSSVFVWSPSPAPEEEEKDSNGKPKKKPSKKSGGSGSGFHIGG